MTCPHCGAPAPILLPPFAAAWVQVCPKREGKATTPTAALLATGEP